MSSTEDTQETPSSQHSPIESQSSAGRGWAKCALAVALLIAVLGALAYWQLWHRLSTLDRARASMADLGTEVSSLNQRLVAVQKSSQSVQQWRWFQIHQLVQWADWQVRYHHNEATALDLLKSVKTDVDLLPASTAQSKAFSSALDRSIKQLEQQPTVDRGHLLLELQAVSEKIAGLPLAHAARSHAKPTADAVSGTNAGIKAEAASLWQRFYQHSVQTFRQAVIIRHRQAHVEPLIPLEQHAYLIEHVQLQLAKAQWAVLRQQPELYQRSLKQAVTWIGGYFSVDAASTQQALSALNMLAKAKLDGKQPDLSGLVRSVDRIMQTTSAASPASRVTS